MSEHTPTAEVRVDAGDLAETLEAVIEEQGGVIRIPVADLPPGSTVSVTIVIGAPAPAPASAPAPEPAPQAAPRYLGRRQA